MPTLNFEKYLDQIGGTLESNQVATDVFSRNGQRVRHSGIFSLDNPAYKMMMSATKNQDIDSLYDQAVQWEINNAILQEQRKYEDPSADIARQRAAGYNPDIAGSAAGGSSAGSSPSMQPIQENIPTSNSYDTADRVTNGINSAVNIANAISGGVTAFTNLAQVKSLLPAQTRIAEADALVAERSVDSRVSLASSTAKNSQIQSSRQYLEYLAELSGSISPDSSDDDAKAILAASGIPQDSIPETLSNLRTYQQNPLLQASVAEGEKRRLLADAFNSAHSSSILEGLYELQAELQRLDYIDSIGRKSIDSAISLALSGDQQYLNNRVATEKQTAENALSQAEFNDSHFDFIQQKFNHAVTAYARQIEFRVDLLNQIDQEISKTEKWLVDNKDLKDSTIEPKTYARKSAHLASLRNRYDAVYCSTADQFSYLVHTANVLQGMKYMQDYTKIGTAGGSLISDSDIQFMNYNFSDILSQQGLMGELINTLTGIKVGGSLTTTSYDSQGNNLGTTIQKNSIF